MRFITISRKIAVPAVPSRVWAAAFLAVCLLSVTPFALADRYVFKWVDANGATHFGDRPPQSDGMTVTTVQIKLRAEPVVEENGDQASSDSEPGEADTEDTFDYENLEIVSPRNDQTYPSTYDEIGVSLSLEPRLRDGDDLRIYWNGSRQSLQSLDVRLANVVAGEHRLQAEVVNASGSLMIRSQPVLFYVQ